jgi:DNA-binding response OmpR family regulator
VWEDRTVMVVDDDESIVELMRDFLEAEGFRVIGALDASQATDVLEREPVDCLILDIMMPGESGFDLCRRVRRDNDVPILFLSARGDDVDKIRGLGLGGDDYIVKSATPAEVVARVKAALRRYAGPERTRDASLTFGPLVLDMQAREVRVSGEPVQFTPREFDLLSLFAEHPRQVFTYDQLLERFWEGVGDRHTVTVTVARIREKIEPDPANPTFIVNVWGVGYRFEGWSSPPHSAGARGNVSEGHGAR